MPTYSLWLEPPPGGLVRDRLSAAIRQASGMASCGPTFAPHVTLAGGCDLPSDAVAAAAAMDVARGLPGGVRIRFESARTGQSYHQSVFLCAAATPELRAAAAAARAAVRARRGGPAPPPGDDVGEAEAAAAYFPHASLLYSDEPTTRAAVMAGVRPGGPLHALLTEAGVALEEEEGCDDDKGPAWTRVTAWRTSGPVDGWACVGDFGAGDGEEEVGGRGGTGQAS